MQLELAESRIDAGNFWRPRLYIGLRPPELRAGFYRLDLATREPTYATLRIAFGNGRPPMRVPLDRTGERRYGKLFSLPQRATALELELEPQLDLAVVASITIERKTWRSALATRRARLWPVVTDPRTSLLKLRQIIAGHSTLSFAGPPVSAAQRQAMYAAWQRAFEGPEERKRIAAGAGPGAFKILHVAVTHADADDALGQMLSRAADDAPKADLLAIETGARLLPPELRANVIARGGRIIACRDADGLLPVILGEAGRIGAAAFAFLERPGGWSALAQDAFAREFRAHPECLAAYGDRDRIDAAGLRSEPQFKPAWSPRFCLAADYIAGAVAFRASEGLLETAGAHAPATSHALLCALAGGRRDAVRHIPRVLFHAPTPGARPADGPHVKHVSLLPASAPRRISIIMPTRDNPVLLRAAAASVLAEPCDLELIIVDNGSRSRQQADVLSALAADARVHVVPHPQPFNFSALINRGRAASSGDMLVLLNDDVQAQSRGWLSALAAVAAEPGAGCAGALLLYPSGRIQHGGVVLGIFGMAGHAFRNLPPDRPTLGLRLDAVHEVAAVTGACLAVRAALFDAVGGFDASLPVTLNDVDFCLRVTARGHRNLMAPHVRLVHRESASRGLDAAPQRAERLAEETARFLAKWDERVLEDPYYSPHLTLGREDFGARDI